MKLSRRTLSVVAILAVLVVGIAWILLGPREVPAGQPPLATLHLEALESFREDFNRDSTRARVIVLLSPT